MKNPFTTLNVDSVLTVFKKAIKQLQQVADENTTVANESAEQASYYTQRQHEALAEVAHAQEVKRKLNELING